MTEQQRELLSVLGQYESSPDGVTVELRFSFSQLIVRTLKQRHLTRRKFAEMANLKESFVSRVLGGDQDITFKTAGNMLHALGLRARVDEIVGTDSQLFEPGEIVHGETTTIEGRWEFNAPGIEGEETDNSSGATLRASIDFDAPDDQRAPADSMV